MSYQKLILCTMFVALAMMICPATLAQANCALRNPDRQIYKIFPDASSYRTIVARVDDEKKHAIEATVGSPLARTDLGKHTIYVVLRHSVPIGFVHARMEIGSRGSIELVWALDLDLSIKAFSVQVSRERNTKAIESDEFKKKLVGRNLKAIKALLSDGNHDVNLAALDLPSNAASIAHIVVLCALKTRVITEIAFADSVLASRQIGNVYRAYKNTASINKLETPLNKAALAATEQALGSEPFPFDKSSFKVFRSISKDGSSNGMLVYAKLNNNKSQLETWWSVSTSGTLINVRVASDAKANVQSAFSAVAGMNLQQLQSTTKDMKLSQKCAIAVLCILKSNGMFEQIVPGP